MSGYDAFLKDSSKYNLESSGGMDASPATEAGAETGATGGENKFKAAAMRAGERGVARGGSAVDTAGSAMMMSGEPYTMAAGAALKVVGSISAKRKAERQAAADAENKRRNNLMTAMAGLGTGIGSTGMA